MSNVIEHKAMLTAGARPSAIVPTDMDQVARLAKMICDSGLAPKGLETPQKVGVAILHGLEVGLTPMAALQRIAVVNGRPTIWGDGAIGLVRASGLCEYVDETIEGEGDNRKGVCGVKRRGEPNKVVRTFSVADAKKAGLWDKGGPWKQYPDRMLQMRARAFALRDVFADVLGGLYLREEIEDNADRSINDDHSHSAHTIHALPPAQPIREVPAIEGPASAAEVIDAYADDSDAAEPVFKPTTSATMIVEAFKMAETLADLETCGQQNAKVVLTEDEANRKYIREQFKAEKRRFNTDEQGKAA